MSGSKFTFYFNLLCNRCKRKFAGIRVVAILLLVCCNYGETILHITDTSLLMNRLGYYMHEGGHSVLPEDWTHFITYMKKFL